MDPSDSSHNPPCRKKSICPVWQQEITRHWAASADYARAGVTGCILVSSPLLRGSVRGIGYTESRRPRRLPCSTAPQGSSSVASYTRTTLSAYASGCPSRHSEDPSSTRPSVRQDG